MVKLFKILTNRLIVAGVLVLIQIVFLLFGILFLSSKAIYLNSFLKVVSIAVVLFIINKSDNPSYKLAWIIPILIFPVFGGLLYLLFGGHRVSKHIRVQALKVNSATNKLLELNSQPEILRELRSMDSSIYNQVCYLAVPQKTSTAQENLLKNTYPIYKCTKTEYLSPGEAFFEKFLSALKKARHFIFLEYFIIEQGEMWDKILEILEKKVEEGVEVRLIYDDFGCIMKLPMNYYKILNRKGIKCRVFNPIKAHALKLSLMNNRDHRKIAVIDGYIGFTGGINLADEYINVTHPFGVWKDSAIMLNGDATWSLTVMFLQMWNFCGPYENFLYRKYDAYTNQIKEFEYDGFVLPYSDTPLDNEVQAEMVYLNMINKAKRYIYITTPYLIIDNELFTALSLAAKNGIDVRIVTPHKYDKWYVHMCTQANYIELVKAGVKIYEYTPGFIHSKTFVSDDETAIVGTVNLDYRSLYLHFECGVFMYKTSAVKQLKDDYINMLEECIEMTERECNKTNIFKRMFRGIIKVFSPLL